MSDLSHFDESGASRMIDVGEKPASHRSATASGLVRMRPETLDLITQRGLKKGDVLEVARLAGIMAAKQTGNLVPLCHPLALESVQVDLAPEGKDCLQISATVQTTGKTGVEMEALTAVSVAALTVYDMCKAVDREISIERVQLEAKLGGASGDFVRGQKGNK